MPRSVRRVSVVLLILLTGWVGYNEGRVTGSTVRVRTVRVAVQQGLEIVDGKYYQGGHLAEVIQRNKFQDADDGLYMIPSPIEWYSADGTLHDDTGSWPSCLPYGRDTVKIGVISVRDNHAPDPSGYGGPDTAVLFVQC